MMRLWQRQLRAPLIRSLCATPSHGEDAASDLGPWRSIRLAPVDDAAACTRRSLLLRLGDSKTPNSDSTQQAYPLQSIFQL